MTRKSASNPGDATSFKLGNNFLALRNPVLTVLCPAPWTKEPYFLWASRYLCMVGYVCMYVCMCVYVCMYVYMSNKGYYNALPSQLATDSQLPCSCSQKMYFLYSRLALQPPHQSSRTVPDTKVLALVAGIILASAADYCKPASPAGFRLHSTI